MSSAPEWIRDLNILDADVVAHGWLAVGEKLNDVSGQLQAALFHGVDAPDLVQDLIDHRAFMAIVDTVKPFANGTTTTNASSDSEFSVQGWCRVLHRLLVVGAAAPALQDPSLAARFVRALCEAAPSVSTGAAGEHWAALLGGVCDTAMLPQRWRNALLRCVQVRDALVHVARVPGTTAAAAGHLCRVLAVVASPAAAGCGGGGMSPTVAQRVSESCALFRCDAVRQALVAFGAILSATLQRGDRSAASPATHPGSDEHDGSPPPPPSRGGSVATAAGSTSVSPATARSKGRRPAPTPQEVAATVEITIWWCRALAVVGCAPPRSSSSDEKDAAPVAVGAAAASSASDEAAAAAAAAVVIEKERSKLNVPVAARRRRLAAKDALVCALIDAAEPLCGWRGGAQHWCHAVGAWAAEMHLDDFRAPLLGIAETAVNSSPAGAARWTQALAGLLAGWEGPPPVELPPAPPLAAPAASSSSSSSKQQQQQQQNAEQQRRRQQMMDAAAGRVLAPLAKYVVDAAQALRGQAVPDLLHLAQCFYFVAAFCPAALPPSAADAVFLLFFFLAEKLRVGEAEARLAGLRRRARQSRNADAAADGQAPRITNADDENKTAAPAPETAAVDPNDWYASAMQRQRAKGGRAGAGPAHMAPQERLQWMRVASCTLLLLAITELVEPGRARPETAAALRGSASLCDELCRFDPSPFDDDATTAGCLTTTWLHAVCALVSSSTAASPARVSPDAADALVNSVLLAEDRIRDPAGVSLWACALEIGVRWMAPATPAGGGAGVQAMDWRLSSECAAGLVQMEIVIFNSYPAGAQPSDAAYLAYADWCDAAAAVLEHTYWSDGDKKTLTQWQQRIESQKREKLPVVESIPFGFQPEDVVSNPLRDALLRCALTEGTEMLPWINALDNYADVALAVGLKPLPSADAAQAARDALLEAMPNAGSCAQQLLNLIGKLFKTV